MFLLLVLIVLSTQVVDAVNGNVVVPSTVFWVFVVIYDGVDVAVVVVEVAGFANGDFTVTVVFFIHFVNAVSDNGNVGVIVYKVLFMLLMIMLMLLLS